MKHTGNKLKAAVWLLLLTCSSVFAQNMDELGVVWDKTYGTGYINSLKPIIAIAGGHGYVAAGKAWNNATPAGIDRCAGLLIEIDESGNEIRRATATIPQAYITAHNNNLTRAEAEFGFAFKTSDGGYLAFGTLGDYNAPGREKEWGWGTNSIEASPALTNGVWIVKFNSQLQIESNELVRGRAIYVAEQMSDGRVVVGGYDAHNNYANVNHTGNGTTVWDSSKPANRTLLRRYNQDGTLSIDARANIDEMGVLYKFPNADEFLSATTNMILRINADLTYTQIGINTLTSNIPNLNMSRPGIGSLTPSMDGGYFLTSDLIMEPVHATNHANGHIFLKANSNNARAYYEIRRPSIDNYTAPLFLPGTGNRYIGVYNLCDNVGCSEAFMYELTDDGTFNARTGPAYPDGTSLRIAGQEDGFFSTGGTQATELAAIAKLSTCSNFVLNAGSTAEQLMVSNASPTASLAGRNITWTGNNGAVSYHWTLTDITPGGGGNELRNKLRREYSHSRRAVHPGPRQNSRHPAIYHHSHRRLHSLPANPEHYGEDKRVSGQCDRRRLLRRAAGAGLGNQQRANAAGRQQHVGLPVAYGR